MLLPSPLVTLVCLGQMTLPEAVHKWAGVGNHRRQLSTAWTSGPRQGGREAAGVGVGLGLCTAFVPEWMRAGMSTHPTLPLQDPEASTLPEHGWPEAC